MGVKEIAYRLRKEKDELVVKMGELHRESEDLFNTTEQFVVEHDLDEDQILDRWDECYKKEDVLIQKRESIQSKINEIDNKLKKIEKTLNYDSLIKGEKIDLCKGMLEEGECYYILLHGSDTVVGHISYRGEIEIEKYTVGNIGYSIDGRYRGKGYASEAFLLLAKKLYSDGVKEVYIAVHNWNEPSLKIAKKFNGILLEELSDEDHSIYKCDLNLIVNKKGR